MIVDSQTLHVVTRVTCCHLCMRLLSSHVSRVTKAVIISRDEIYEQDIYATDIFQPDMAMSMFNIEYISCCQNQFMLSVVFFLQRSSWLLIYIVICFIFSFF